MEGCLQLGGRNRVPEVPEWQLAGLVATRWPARRGGKVTAARVAQPHLSTPRRQITIEFCVGERYLHRDPATGQRPGQHGLDVALPEQRQVREGGAGRRKIGQPDRDGPAAGAATGAVPAWPAARGSIRAGAAPPACRDAG